MTKTPAKTDKNMPTDKEAKSIRLPVNKLYPVSLFVEADDRTVETRKVNEIAELVWLPNSLDNEEKNARIVRAVELYESLKPADGAKSMLAAQMVGTHSAALECLRRAVVDGQTFARHDMALKHAQQLMVLYAKQLDTLNKHRGKGQQKVTVEYVNVAAGGRAIVGNVNTGDSQGDIKLTGFDHSPEMPLTDVTPPKKAKSKKPRT